MKGVSLGDLNLARVFSVGPALPRLSKDRQG